MANSNTMTNDQLIAKLDQIATSRQDWEQNQYQSSNKILYKMLGKCLSILAEVSKNAGLQNHLAAQLKLKKIAFNKKTSLETRVVRWVFGDCKKRAYLYVDVLQIAKSTKPINQGMTAWIESEGGLENISRSKNGANPADKRSKRIQAASDHFKILDPIGLIEVEDEQFAASLDTSNMFSVALLRNDGSGALEIVHGSSNQAIINTLLAGFGRDLQKNKSDQLDTAAIDEASPAADATTTSGIDAEPADAGQEVETQGDTKSDENATNSSTDNRTRREETTSTPPKAAASAPVSELAA